MKSLLIYLPFLLSLINGYLFVGFLFRKNMASLSFLHFFLAGGLGLGISGQVAFLNFILFGKFNALFIAGFHLILFIFLSLLCFCKARAVFSVPFQGNKFHLPHIAALVGIIVLFIPTWYIANFYIYGGWDAWAVWNLKSRMLFLSDDWQRIFHPALWRSSPHYPLLLPFINIWGWTFAGETLPQLPTLTSLIFTFLTLGLLYFSLKKFISPLIAFVSVSVIMTLPLFVRLATSQYSDMVVGYYLSAGMFCLILATSLKMEGFAVLAGLMTGFLSFTKNEGLLASVVLVCLGIPYLLRESPREERKRFLLSFLEAVFISHIPAIAFQIFYAPEDILMINGLTSREHPVSLLRLKTIFGYYLIELGLPVFNLMTMIKTNWDTSQIIPMKWHGVWIVFFIGLIAGGRRCFRPPIALIPLFLLFYLLAISGWYFINTWRPVDWWLSVTFARVMFSLLPLFIFWIFYTLWGEKS